MKIIKNYQQIQTVLAEIKSQGKGLLTNFYIPEQRCNLLINNSLLFIENFEDSAFILRLDRDFYNLSFLATDKNSLQNGLKSLTAKYPDLIFVADIIGTEKDADSVAKLFADTGFEEYEKLFRMSRTKNLDEPQNLNPNVVFADSNQSETIKTLLETWFDKYSEQLPLSEDIKQWIDNNKVVIYRENGQTVGFVIFETNGQTSYLRYWFTHPNFRDKKIGSALLRRFFYECRNTKRQSFWVIAKNENAVVRYQHYGFAREQLTDVIMKFN